MPETSLGETVEKHVFWRLPVHAEGDIHIFIYTASDEESGLKVRNAQFSPPGAKLWKKTNI